MQIERSAKKIWHVSKTSLHTYISHKDVHRHSGNHGIIQHIWPLPQEAVPTEAATSVNAKWKQVHKDTSKPNTKIL